MSLISPAGKFLTARAKDKRNKAYSEWRAGVPLTHILDMVNSGLRPFLAKYGYTLQNDTPKVAGCILNWAFAHVWVQQNRSKGWEVHFQNCSHTGGPEEFDWYCHRIPIDAWTNFCTAWATTEFLDDSDAGRAQCVEFYECIWHLISLNASRAHQIWLDTVYEETDDDEQGAVYHQEEHAFGGDRRTH